MRSVQVHRRRRPICYMSDTRGRDPRIYFSHFATCLLVPALCLCQSPAQRFRFCFWKKNIEFMVSAFQENATGRYGKRTLRILEPSMISERNVDFPAEMFPSTQSVTPLLRSCEETNDIARIATFGRQKCRARAGWCAGIRYDREKRHLAEAATPHWVWNSLSIRLRKPFFLKRSNRATGHVSSKTRVMNEVKQVPEANK